MPQPKGERIPRSPFTPIKEALWQKSEHGRIICAS